MEYDLTRWGTGRPELLADLGMDLPDEVDGELDFLGPKNSAEPGDSGGES